MHLSVEPSISDHPSWDARKSIALERRAPFPYRVSFDLKQNGLTLRNQSVNRGEESDLMIGLNFD